MIYSLLLEEFYEFLPAPFSEMPLSERGNEESSLIWVDFVAMMDEALQESKSSDSDKTCFILNDSPEE